MRRREEEMGKTGMRKMTKTGNIVLLVFFLLVCLLALVLLIAGFFMGAKERAEEEGGEEEGGGGGSTGSQLQPCSLTANFSALPSITTCCPGGDLRIVPLGGVPFIASSIPVSYTVACGSLCERLDQGSNGVRCISSQAGAQKNYEVCITALSPVGKCNGLAQPLGTAGTSFLYAQRAASNEEASACAKTCIF